MLCIKRDCKVVCPLKAYQKHALEIKNVYSCFTILNVGIVNCDLNYIFLGRELSFKFKTVFRFQISIPIWKRITASLPACVQDSTLYVCLFSSRVSMGSMATCRRAWD